MIEVKKYKVTSQEQSNIGNLIVGTALCCLYCLTLLLISLLHFATQYNVNELPTLKQQISNTEIKIFSQVCTMRREIIRQTNEIESLIYDSENDNRTDVKPFNNDKPRQGDPSDNETPKGLLPP
jgi:hypothetical protein